MDVEKLVNDMTNMYITERITTDEDSISCLVSSFEKMNISHDNHDSNKDKYELMLQKFQKINLDSLDSSVSEVSKPVIIDYINEIINALTHMIRKPSCSNLNTNSFLTPNWVE